ncbi:MAG TPA: hypothetical protein VHD90_16580 [Phototrophicaceae bacterium]|nr:hypothetical protein [Phototrophicaceae bacterium]
MIQDDYFSFLDYRAAQRRLAARFAHPRALTLHTLAFIVAVTTMLAYGVAVGWWYDPSNLLAPTVLGFIWSLLLLLHAVWHYRRSAASSERREVAVEEAMRQLIAQHEGGIDNEQRFTLHLSFEAALEQQGSWSGLLLAFAVVNAVSWGLSVLNVGTSWPFQMTQPLAVLILGGGAFYVTWQRRRREGQRNWFTRIPVLHIALYAIGAPILALLGAYHAINYWDAQTLIGWWTLIVLAHILFAVVILPLIERLIPQREVAKRKPSQRLMVGDDGELVEIDEPEIRQARTDRL